MQSQIPNTEVHDIPHGLFGNGDRKMLDVEQEQPVVISINIIILLLSSTSDSLSNFEAEAFPMHHE